MTQEEGCGLSIIGKKRHFLYSSPDFTIQSPHVSACLQEDFNLEEVSSYGIFT